MSETDASIGELPVPSGSAYPPSIQAGIPRLGPTPQGWSRARLGELLSPIYRPAEMCDDVTYQLVTAKRNRAGIVARERLTGEQIKVKNQYIVRTGDFIISNRQISHGGCGLVPPELDGAIVSGEYTVLNASGPIDLKFLNHFVHSVYFQQICFHSSIGVHVEKLVFRSDDWFKWEVNLPPLDEQQEIATVLSSWDQTIGTANALLSAKRQQYLAACAHLFGRQRNPFRTVGVPLGKFAKVAYGKGLAQPEYNGAGSSSVYGTQGVIGRTDKAMGTGPAIIVGRKGTLNRPSIVRTNERFWAIDTTFVVRSQMSATVLHAFLGYVDLSHLSEASGVPSLAAESLAALQVPVDRIKRQERSMERLILEMEQDVDKTRGLADSLRAQRRGLMQKLLTGQWRLGESKRFAEAAA
jgi:type I restriction enzyme, S subunit